MRRWTGRPANATRCCIEQAMETKASGRSEEHTSELQSPDHLVCRLLLEKKLTITARPACPAIGSLGWQASGAGHPEEHRFPWNRNAFTRDQSVRVDLQLDHLPNPQRNVAGIRRARLHRAEASRRRNVHLS